MLIKKLKILQNQLIVKVIGIIVQIIVNIMKLTNQINENIL